MNAYYTKVGGFPLCACRHERGDHLGLGPSHGKNNLMTACCAKGCKCRQWRPRVARIRLTRWDNWYGYLGGRRVIAFGNGVEETAEQAAERWLKENSSRY